MFRSTLEATVMGLEPAATPPTGTVVMPAQLIAYDDTVVTPANYEAGNVDTERHITVLYEEPLTMDLAAFDGITQAAATALWTDALEQWKTRILPAAPNMLKAIRAARRTNPSVI